MKRFRWLQLCTAMLLNSAGALAQGNEEPQFDPLPVVPEQATPSVDEASDPQTPPLAPPIANPRFPTTATQSWSERCLQRPSGYYGTTYWVVHPTPVIVVDRPIGPGVEPGRHAARPVSPRPSTRVGSGGSGEGAGALVLAAVVVSAVAPFIFYAVDDVADADVLGRYDCPWFELETRGGVEGDVIDPGMSNPLSLRFRAGTGLVGVVSQFDISPWTSGRSLLSGLIAGWIRFEPRQHLDMGLTFGYRSLMLRGEWRPGFDFAIPHEYVLYRNGASQLGIEVRPGAFLWHRGIDVSLDVGLRIPLGAFVSLVIGGRIFSVDALTSAGAGATGGIAVHF